jgi:hypothetical protein
MGTARRRKPRPSRGRGLRSTAGCFTCRNRRLKCDEEKPLCGPCAKSSRDCIYPSGQGEDETADAVALSNESSVGEHEPPSHVDHGRNGTEPQPEEPARSGTDKGHASQFCAVRQGLSAASLGLHDAHQHESLEGGQMAADLARSPSTTASFAAGTAPYQWYELIARDAWKNADQYQFLTSHSSRWSFNLDTVGQHMPVLPQQSPVLSDPLASPSHPATAPISHEFGDRSRSVQEAWNMAEPVALGAQETDYLQYYIESVGPLLDLFDATRQHFSNYVLHLALRNEGLLKSVLAVAASHLASHPRDSPRVSINSLLSSQSEPTTRSHRENALQYYYETLGYLSQAMRLPGFVHGEEILANAALISWYEAFESDTSPNWERHLKGVFWLQRQRNSDGESHGMPGAIWWSWLRQDIWAAFRHGRRTLTIWQPTKSISALNSEELIRYVLYIQAKAVSYASAEAIETLSFEQRMRDAEDLLVVLEEWRAALPKQSYSIPTSTEQHNGTSLYKPRWIHPPKYAAALQAYNIGKLLVSLNRPSLGGRQEFRDRQKVLEASIEEVAGIASAPNATYSPLAVSNSQALFIVGQYVQKSEAQVEILRLLRTSLEAAHDPSRILENELRQLWGWS